MKNAKYKAWKRKNVTLRGIKELGADNGVWGSFGKGLYTAFLSNAKMARGYGKLYFVVNAIPDKPKKVQYLNDAEILVQTLVSDFCAAQGVERSKAYFDQHTTIEAEMLKLGYNGLIIQGREMVHYDPKNVLYFETENELINYFEHLQYTVQYG